MTQAHLSSSFDMAALEAGKHISQELQDKDSLKSRITIHKLAAELIGTYILILIGVGSILVDQRVKITLLGVAFVWGTVVTVLVYTISHISGCHLNPAVTFAFAVIRQFPWKLVTPYAVVQVLGAILASETLRFLFVGIDTDLMLSHPAGSSSNLNAVACEIIVTFILMFVICGSATDTMAAKELAGVAIGAAVFCNVLISGTISGASMNPARSLGPAIATMNFESVWIYVVSPVIGAVFGSTLYHFIRLPKSLIN
ncbi:aquaporin NIP protein [Dioscorea alata]|uniref:Aquaporin NIP protein n=1 Tax=Dioscorea alata TaxID=55571 RepID=A0ACB7TXK0_DIOAL|nr:aquaporin NIP protein [Dioscorea alata]